MTETSSGELPILQLQDVDPRSVRVDPDTGVVSAEMFECLSLLGEISVNPGQVRLVITGDFVGSVQQRLAGDRSSEFDVERGSGMVAAKTMPGPDGFIDVLVPWWFFDVDREPAQRAESAALVVRTVVHEAHHVAMRQNQQGYKHADAESWRETNLRSAADSVIDEYRAESGVAATLVEEYSPWSPVEVLDALGRDVGKAVASYQEHLDVERLAFETGTACLVGWRALAYIAAVDVADRDRSPVTSEVAEDPLWKRLAANYWDEFRAVLQAVPAGRDIMPQADIALAVETLAVLLGKWLDGLGFTWTDNEFRIQSWYFEDEYFLAAEDDRIS